MARYAVYDVFAERVFEGNPLAVVLDGDAVPEDALQAVAREFGFSETTFVYPPSDCAHTARVRIFTPTQEVPFAGHPTIGTAVALHDGGQPAEQVLELGVGPLPCRVDGGAARFAIPAILRELSRPEGGDVAACLSLDASDLSSDATPLQATIGLPFTLVELGSLAALGRARPDRASFAAAAARYPSDFDFSIYAYVRDGEAVRARMFAPLDDIPEDPATGSAAALLGAALASQDRRTTRLDGRQGVEMGRPSRIAVTAEWVDDRLGAVTIAGRARRVMEGRLLV